MGLRAGAETGPTETWVASPGCTGGPICGERCSRFGFDCWRAFSPGLVSDCKLLTAAVARELEEAPESGWGACDAAPWACLPDFGEDRVGGGRVVDDDGACKTGATAVADCADVDARISPSLLLWLDLASDLGTRSWLA